MMPEQRGRRAGEAQGPFPSPPAPLSLAPHPVLSLLRDSQGGRTKIRPLGAGVIWLTLGEAERGVLSPRGHSRVAGRRAATSCQSGQRQSLEDSPGGLTRCQRRQRHHGSQTPRHACRHA